ncbi:MAG: hypothetical protein AABX82_08955, partial [Nanoarchaeota archaeon]
IDKGIEKRPATIGFHTSACATELLELYLHKKNLIYENSRTEQIEVVLKTFLQLKERMIEELKEVGDLLAVKIGNLEEWDLKESILREGIILFGQSNATRMQKYLLFSLTLSKEPKKRIFVIRKLFGRMEKEYHEQGIVQKNKGKILSPRIFIVPAIALKEITQFLAEEKVQYEFEEIWK